MRTTLDIEDDVLFAAKDLALGEKKTAGQVISEPARKGLTGDRSLRTRRPPTIHGFRPFPSEGRIVSIELVNRLGDEGDYQVTFIKAPSSGRHHQGAITSEPAGHTAHCETCSM